jgi:hypothetical protein
MERQGRQARLGEHSFTMLYSSGYLCLIDSAKLNDSKTSTSSGSIFPKDF